MKFDVESMGETRPAYQVLADFSEKNAPELTALGFHRERLTRFRKRYMWRSLSGRELSRFLEAQYAPAFRYGDNCIWNFLGFRCSACMPLPVCPSARMPLCNNGPHARRSAGNTKN